MDDDGQIEEAHSISAGLDYPGIGPEHAWLNDMGRVKFLSATDDEAVAAFQLCSKLEGIIPALEAGACAGQRARHRGEEAEGSPDGGQSFRPRRQGSGVGRGLSRKQEAMSTRIERRFAALKKEGRAALVTFTMAGDPDYDTSLAIAKALPKAGADVIELGMPFTDPMADGPAIQAAGLRALKSGQRMTKTLALVREFRKERRRNAHRADGLLQSDLHLWRRPLSRRCQGGRRRWPDRRRLCRRRKTRSFACRR